MIFTNHKKNKKAYIFKGNKRGSSYWFIFTIAFAFVLTILYIIFGQILNVYLYPTSQYLSAGNTTTQDKWLGFWGMVPYMIIFIILAFLYFRLTQSQSGE